MTKKHFIEAARMIACIRDDEERKQAADMFAAFFRQFNNNFKHERFMEACDVRE